MGDHDFMFDQDFLGEGVTPGCSCGWEARLPYDSVEDAQEAWENHCDVMFMEATSHG